MSNASKYRKKAVEYEQLKQFDRAVASYVRAIEENENASEEVDVALFNKVGDLTLRQGRVTEAVTYYERAVEHYVSNNLFDNAIALCNKILRNAPGRSNVYFTLGRICGRKGLRSDATRNFLEYATRMQQEGRVDEGMRALAEVADLMPELTEVRRLVEEHAARAGISLTRRRDTPARAAAQPESEPSRLFGMSKDLVFLEIDYDAAKPARDKTPPPLRSVTLENPPVATAVAPAVPISAPAPVPAAAAPAPSGRLEDLMIFDPRGESHDTPVSVDAVESTVVDGASILKPYVDPETPVVSLADLEPTGFVHATVDEESVISGEPVSDILQRGVAAPVAGAEVVPEPPVVITRVPTIPNFPAVTADEEVVALDDVQSGISAQLFSDQSAESENAPTTLDELRRWSDEALADEVHTDSAQAEDETHVVVANETDDSTLVAPVADVVEETISSVAPLFVASTTPLATSADAVESGTLGTVADASDEIVNFAAEHELNQTLAAPTLDGFTADEEPTVAADILSPEAVDELIVVEAVTPTAIHTEAGVLPSIDFDAMLESAPSEIETVADLEFEEFAPANNELAAARFVRLEEESNATLVDAFESENELPPLIFPVPSAATDRRAITDDLSLDDLSLDDVSIDTIETAEVYGASNGLEFLDTDIADLDAIQFKTLEIDAITSEVVDLDSIRFKTLELEAIKPEAVDLDSIRFKTLELEAIKPEASSLEAPSVDDADTFEPTPADEPPEVVGLVFLDIPPGSSGALTPLAVESVSTDFADDDLDDLFGDTGIPTAVVAAEATLVASSRCAELQSASNADPENFVLRRRLAEALFESGDRDAAISELGAALAGAELVGALSDAADIADELVRVARDEAAHHQKRLELAIRLGEQTRLRVAYLDFADNLVRRGEDLRAKAVYARVLEMDPYDDRARAALGDAAPPPPAKPSSTPDDGHVSLADWLRDDDEPTSTRLRMREPDVSGDEQDDFNALLKHFKVGVARSLGEDDYESHYDLGVAYKEMGLLDDAIGEFQMALRSKNNRLAAYEALGQCFLEQQSYKVAVTVLSRALHEPAVQDEQRVGVLYLLGYSCEVLQRFDEARSYFQRVYATDIHFRDVAQRLADLERTVR